MKENRLATEQYIKELIDNSFLDNDEKKYWNDILSEMTENQLLKLANILILDKKEQIIEFNEIILKEYGKDENI